MNFSCMSDQWLIWNTIFFLLKGSMQNDFIAITLQRVLQYNTRNEINSETNNMLRRLFKFILNNTICPCFLKVCLNKVVINLILFKRKKKQYFLYNEFCNDLLQNSLHWRTITVNIHFTSGFINVWPVNTMKIICNTVVNYSTVCISSNLNIKTMWCWNNQCYQHTTG